MGFGRRQRRSYKSWALDNNVIKPIGFIDILLEKKIDKRGNIFFKLSEIVQKHFYFI